MRFWLVALFQLSVSAQVRASDDCGTYPPKVSEGGGGWSGCDLKDAGQSPLWHGVGDNRRAQVVRFVFTEGHGSFYRYVTITENTDGSAWLKSGGSGRTTQHRRRSAATNSRKLQPDEITALKAAIDVADPFGFEVGSWDGNELYMHCQFLEMERVNAKGYGYSSVNIGCNHPDKLMPLVNLIARLGGLNSLNDGRLYY